MAPRLEKVSMTGKSPVQVSRPAHKICMGKVKHAHLPPPLFAALWALEQGQGL